MTGAPLKIAIVGGGLAGTILMNALCRHPHLDVDVYEASASFKERGASVGLSSNALRALGLLGFDELLKKAGGVSVLGCRLVVGEGPDAGKTILDVGDDLVTVHRAALLRELLDRIPKDKMHVNKRLVSIEGTTIKFEDGTTTTADAIIGADGIHGPVRRYVLGDNHPQLDPVFAGFWDCRAVMPAEEAVAKLGTDRIDLSRPRQHLYCGNDIMLFHDVIDDAKSVCVVAGGTCPPDWNKDKWNQTVKADWLYKAFVPWGEPAKNMLDLLIAGRDELSVFVQWESGVAPTFYKDRILMIGDAAHATTPWQGSGLGQVIEDILMLENLLVECNGPDDIVKAFSVFDSQRRPRTQRVIESSRETGHIFLGQRGLELEATRRILDPRWDFIHKYDTAGELAKALELFKQKRDGGQ